MCPIHEDESISTSSRSRSEESLALDSAPRLATPSKLLLSPSPRDLELMAPRSFVSSGRPASENDFRLFNSPQANLHAKSAESLAFSSSPMSLFLNFTGSTASSASSFASAKSMLFKPLDRQSKRFLASYHAALRSCRPFSAFLSTAAGTSEGSRERSHAGVLSLSPVCQPLEPRSSLSPYPHAEAAAAQWIHPTLLAASQSPRSMAATVAPDIESATWDLRRPTWKMCLHPGAVFSGIQQSNQRQYEVTVQIQHVVLEESFLCGYLNINGLTYEYPSLTTFFEAEIIGAHYSFVTRKWDTNPEIDLRHWEMFPQFQKYCESFQIDSSSATTDPLHSDYIFMRWKEQFLVPNHHITSITGASYDGFYYICLNLATGDVSGYYYYQCAKEWFEELHLSYEPLRSRATYSFQ